MNILQHLLKFFRRQKKPVVIVKPVEKKLSLFDSVCVDYILGELLKFVSHEKQANLSLSLKPKLETLNSAEIKILTEMISKHFRRNAIYDYLFEKGYSWNKKRVSIGEIYLTRINEQTNKILESLENPYNLLDLIKSNPEDCELLSIDERKIANFMPICVQREDGRIDVLDGNHRICIFAKGKKYIDVILRTKND